LCAENKETDGEIFNACSGIQVTIQELCDMVKEKMGCKDLEVKHEDWRKGDIKFFNVSNKKISNLGITFEKNLSEILNDLIIEYKEYLKN
jgi:nucleoside-diphosphate-sugar epimerase